MTLPDGIHENIPFEDYLKIDAINVSLLKELLRSPGHLKYAKDHDKDPTPAMIFGSAVDYWITAEDSEAAFNEKYCFRPDSLDLRTKAGKEWKEKVGDRIGVPYTVLSCAEAILMHEEAHAWIKSSRAQLTLIWTDEQTGVRCKGRPDLVSGAAVTDLKTTQGGIDSDTWARYVLNNLIHWQLTYYMRGLATLGEPKSIGRLIVAEQAPPHGVEVYELEGDWYDVAQIELARALEFYAYQLKQDTWFTTTGVVQMLPMPSWGRR